MFRNTPVWFMTGFAAFMGCLLLLEGIITSNVERVFGAIVWTVAFAVFTAYAFEKDAQKKKKKSFDSGREKFGSQVTFSIKQNSIEMGQIKIGADYVWKQEKLDENLFRGAWVKIIRKTKNRVIVEITSKKVITTVHGTQKVVSSPEKKYVNPEELYRWDAIDWFEFDSRVDSKKSQKD